MPSDSNEITYPWHSRLAYPILSASVPIETFNICVSYNNSIMCVSGEFSISFSGAMSAISVPNPDVKYDYTVFQAGIQLDDFGSLCEA